jgi:hypothetical protein
LKAVFFQASSKFTSSLVKVLTEKKGSNKGITGVEIDDVGERIKKLKPIKRLV